ncbi:hypothetical protein A1353_20370 [Methylomonas methanica]|uniref:histidine kinase n=2 Tax=Methylomonas methanica TaxID=421 RepID=A0A177M1V0_METMH|nr:hypothetical protein A1353_20370 [Methylomonas methanica]
METLAIVMAMLVYGITWNTYRQELDGKLILLGCAMLSVGFIDFAHTLSFQGMPDFVTPSGAEKAINFWLAARFLATLGLLGMATLPHFSLVTSRSYYGLLVATLVIISLVYWLGLFHADRLPATFIDGQGLTQFKIRAEWLIAIVLLVTAVLFFRQARRAVSHDAANLFAATALSILSELCFTLYTEVTDVFNLLGHFYKVVAYLFIYLAVFVQTVRAPYQRLAETQARLVNEQEALQRQSAILSLFYELPFIGMAITSAQTKRWVLVNDYLCQMLGYPRAELIEKSWDELTHPEDLQADLSLFERLLNDEIDHYVMDKRFLHKDGTVIFTTINIRCVGQADGVIQQVVATVQDITARHQLEEEQRQTLRHLETIANASPALFWTAGLDKGCNWFNQRWLDFTGRTLQQEQGYGWSEGVHPDDFQRSLATYVDAFDAHQPFAMEYRLRRHDGEFRWLLDQGMPRCDADGEFIGYIGSCMDITEEKSTRDALNASEQRLRLALQAAKQGIYDLNVQTGEAIVSPEYASMLGYDPETFRETNAAWIERLHPDDLESVAQTYEHYIAGELPEYRVEFRQRTQAGQWKWILSSGSIVERSPDGRPLRMLGTHTDIDSRKETELALRYQMERLHRAEAHARLGSWELFVDNHQPGWWSAEMYQLLGVDPAGGVPTFDEYIGYLHPEDQPLILETLNQMANGIEPTPAPFRSNPERGPQCWFNPSVNCERDAEGRPIKFFGTLLDITAIKNAETALRKSEERLRTLINTIPDLIWLKDPDGIYLLCNQMFERLFGAKEADITGKTDYDFVDRRLADSFRENDLKAIKAGQPSINEEWLTFNEGGYHGYFETIKTPVMGSDGQLIGVLGISRDITVIIEAQESLRQLNASLEARVAERTNELQALNQSLESFVYSVSHDLKTPLRGVEGYSRLLQEDYDTQLDNEGRQFINNIREGIKRMNELIDDLLAYSRMERRKLETNPINLNALLKSVLAELTNEFDARGVKIDVTLPPLTVHADAEGLTMVLRNLLGNAIKFSAHSGQPQIEISGSQQGEDVTLWIKDNGIGFDMKYHERIFEIFQRLHRLEDYPGTGIGLALVKKAMDRMNGKVWAESKLGEYAKFYIMLKS